MAGIRITAESTAVGGGFAPTHWSVVLAASDPASPQASKALDRLCGAYWPPLYAYIRRDGYGVEDAQDLTQEFLARLVHKEWLASSARCHWSTPQSPWPSLKSCRLPPLRPCTGTTFES